MISKKNKTIVVALVIAACCIGVAGLGAVAALRGNAVASPGEIYVPRGATYRSLADSLEAGGHIRNMGMFDFTARLLGMGDNVRPGYYRLKKGAGYMQLVRMFQRGLQTPVRVTFNNIRTLPQLAGRLAQQVEPDSATLAGIITSDTTAIHYGFTPRTLAAMFIPDTYEFYWTVTPVGLLDRLKTEYDRFWNEQREAKLAAVGLTRVQAVTLASIVFEETKMSDEMPIVAGVYINRLRRGMKLQADPTVKFAVGDPTLRRILYKHLDVDSPYNTYMYEGLPPGPICLPPITAVDAVLDYRHHDYLYFCARPDFSGYHNFAVTLAQHNRNRQAWVEALNRAGIR